MNRLSILLIVLIVVEAATLAFRFVNPPLPEFPLADLTLLGDRATVEALAEMPRELDRRNPADWKGLGEFYLTFGFYPQAEMCFRTAHRLAPHDDSLLLLLAISLDRLGEKRRAIDYYRLAIENNVPDAETFRIRIATCLFALDDDAAAVKELEAMKDHPEARLMRSRVLIRSGGAREALTVLETLQRDFPDCLEPYRLSSWAAEELGDDETAYAFQNRSLRTRNQIPRNTLVRQIDVQRRRQHSYFALHMRSLEFEAAGRNEEARQACQEAIRALWDEDIVRSSALLEINLGQPRTAIKLLNEAIQRVGASAATLDALGEALNRVNEPQQARDAWLLACEMQPAASIHEKLAKSFTAIEDLPRAQWHRGLAEYERGKQAWLDNQIAEALERFRSATELAPSHASSWYYFAESLLLSGDFQAAGNAFERCLAIDPNHGRAWHGLQRLAGTPPPE